MPYRIFPLPQPGHIFGLLTFTGKFKYGGQIECECSCACGSGLRLYRLTSLQVGHTKSCGCWNAASRITHGQTQASEYRAWCAMKARCLNTKTGCYKNYGGRGITVCDEWRDSFKAFFAHIGPRPSPNHSIDRYPDNNGNYEPGNVRWATAPQQRRNSRQNTYLTINGETHCLADWARIAGVGNSAFSGRIKRNWPKEKLLSPPDFRRRVSSR